MVAAGKRETSRHLTKSEADLYAKEFMEALQQFTFSKEPATPEEVATLTRSGIRFFDGRLPTATENTASFLLDLFGPFIGPGRDENSVEACLKEYGKELADPPSTAKGLHDLLSRIYLHASPEEVTALRDLVQKLRSRAAKPLEMRDQMIVTLRKSIKGTPGPKSVIPEEAWNHIMECSDRLHAVCFKMLEFTEESKQPLPEIIKAIVGLHPEWKAECDFLSERTDLVLRSMKLAKIKKAKTRGKASKLADALACEFAGYSRAPSYSMQILEQARRSQKD